MRTKLLLAIVAFVLAVFFSAKVFVIYAQGSCGQYRIFEPSCSELVSSAEAQRLTQGGQSPVEEIMQINPGLIQIYAQPQARCPGKSIIIISHPSENDCDSLNKAIRKYFAEVPYEIVNN